jgi:hypothetical protein
MHQTVNTFMHQDRRKFCSPSQLVTVQTLHPLLAESNTCPKKNIKESMPPADCNKLELFRHLIQLEAPDQIV